MFSNETKIGLLTIVSLAMLVWGYKYLKGKNILSSSTFLYVEYKDVDQLTISTPVLRNGFQIGIVGDIYFKEDMSTLEVVLDLDTDVNIPKTAVAEIISTGFMGGRAIDIVFDVPCSGGNCAQSGDKIKGVTKKLLASMVGEPDDITGYMDVVKDNVGGIIDTIKNKVVDPNAPPNEDVKNVQEIIENLKNATAKLDRLMTTSSGKLDAIVADAGAITSNLKANNDKINSILANANTLTSNLSKTDIEGTVNKLSSTMDGASGAISNLETTLSSADDMVNSLNAVLGKVNNQEGTLGLLVNDKELYNNLDRALKNMDFLMQDLRLHPERYRRILSKKKMPYEAPEQDPAFN